MSAGVDETGLLTAALSELSDLSQDEYRLSLSELLKGVKRKDEEAVLRFTRLLGIMVKRPFAKSYDLAPNMTRTGAHRGWRWVPEQLLSKEATDTWQYRPLLGVSQFLLF